MKERVNNSDFVRIISKKTGLKQKDIKEMLEAGAETILDNLKNGVATVVFSGMVVYPSTYKNEYIFPRARFGKYFKMSSSVS